MKRFSFTAQLLILFFILLLISSCLFGGIVIGRVKTISQSETYERLETYVDYTKDDWSIGEPIKGTDKNIKLGIIQGYYDFNVLSGIITYKSDNLDNILNGENLMRILDCIKLKPNSANHDYINSEYVEKLYYAYQIAELNENNHAYFVVIITNDQYARNFSTNISTQVITIFSVVFVFSFIILGLWGGSYVSRINRLKKHIANLPSSNYQEEYEDDGRDELADLSRSVELMRKEILQNELTKQEMLQNISHDFKTPIAVIKSYAEAIEDGMAGSDDAAIIQNQASVLQHKVNILLQYNRLSYLEKSEAFKECSMKEIIENVINTYRYQTNDIEFVLDLDESKFKGYDENYYTVIDNIVDNAKRYAKSTIKLTLHNGVLRIYNDGEHIDEQFLSGFKAYEKGSKGQFGLGMSIVKKTLDFFGYDLNVYNEEVGVTFEIKKHIQENIYTQ